MADLTPLRELLADLAAVPKSWTGYSPDNCHTCR
jgi:hypothetical protein